MTSPTAKDYSTAQAQAALAGFALAQANGMEHGTQPGYTMTRHGQQVDLTDWQQVRNFLKEVQHHA